MQITAFSAAVAWAMPEPGQRMTLRDFLCIYRPAELVVSAFARDHLAGLSAWLEAENGKLGEPPETRGNGEPTFATALLFAGLDRFLASEGVPVGLDCPAYEPADPAHLLETVNWAELGLEEAERTGLEPPEIVAGRRAGIAWGDERLLHDSIHRPAALGWGPNLPEDGPCVRLRTSPAHQRSEG